MQRRCAVRTARALVLAMTAVAGLLWSTTAPQPAQAAEPTALVSITLTSLTPALATRHGTVAVTGRVTNISNAPLRNLQAVFWRSRDPSRDPIVTKDSLTRALDSAADDPIGERLFNQDYQNFPLHTNRVLDPQKSATFSLTTDVANLDFPRADGIYLLGVHVRGRTVDDPRDQTLGRSRVFLPLVDHAPRTALRMTSVVVLNSRPSLVAPGVLLDEHLAKEIGSRGRLTELLDAADTSDVTFAIDPALIEELRTMKAGYKLAGGATGAGQAAAGRWLDRFKNLMEVRDGYRLLYGSPDLAALVHSRQRALLDATVAAGASVESIRSLPLLVLPAGGAADAATVAAAEALHPAAILLADMSVQAGTPLLTGPGKAPIASYTSTAFGGGPGPSPQHTPVHLRQRMLADTWLEASTAAPGSTHGRVRLVTSAAQAKGEDSGVDAPWITQSSLTDLLKSTPTSWDQAFHYLPASRAAELTSTQLSRLREFSLSQRSYADLLVDSNAAKAAAATAVARAASATWRQHAKAQNNWLAPQQDNLDATLHNRVEISSSRGFSTVARQGVEFPITVKNDLPRSDTDPRVNAVKLRVVFTSDNTQRLTIKTIDLPPIQAQDNTTARAKVTAKANGVVPVTAQLTTMSGLKVGRPVTINVKVTQNGTTGWAIAIAAGVVLVGSTSLRIRQVNRERALAEQQAAAAEPIDAQSFDALSSAPPTDPQANLRATSADHFDA